jgi:hypothetical protein
MKWLIFSWMQNSKVKRKKEKKEKKNYVGRWVGCNKMLLRALKQPNEFY